MQFKRTVSGLSSQHNVVTEIFPEGVSDCVQYQLPKGGMR
jgi:hypothetical protein